MQYGTVIIASWIVFLLVWAVTAFGVKRDVQGVGMVGMRLALALIVLAVLLRFATELGHGRVAFAGAFFTPPPALGWVAAALSVLGTVFAIWARVHLGTNWSPAPAIKEKHELITSGPYAFVRHPIYTGVILAAFGSALSGTLFGIGILFIFSIAFFLRINKEERILLGLFPDAYPAYQAKTKKLIPFVW